MNEREIKAMKYDELKRYAATEVIEEELSPL